MSDDQFQNVHISCIQNHQDDRMSGLFVPWCTYLNYREFNFRGI